MEVGAGLGLLAVGSVVSVLVLYILIKVRQQYSEVLVYTKISIFGWF